jgi:hypothetical protein
MSALQHVAERIHVVYEDTLGVSSSTTTNSSMSYLEYVPSR